MEGCERVTHFMHLQDAPFQKIAAGPKTFELRLYDEKRKAVKVGDTIVFDKLADSNARITTTVVAIHVFDSFEELYATLPLEKCGYAKGEDALPSDMEKYYSKEEQAQYGVVGIEIALCDTNK